MKSFKKIRKGEEALLYIIIKMLGGPLSVANTMGVTKQVVTNWRCRGFVPMKHVKKMAQHYKISDWGLNYSVIAGIREKPLIWETVVGLYEVPPAIKTYILTLPHPEVI